MTKNENSKERSTLPDAIVGLCGNLSKNWRRKIDAVNKVLQPGFEVTENAEDKAVWVIKIICGYGNGTLLKYEDLDEAKDGLQKFVAAVNAGAKTYDFMEDGLGFFLVDSITSATIRESTEKHWRST